MTGAFIQNSLFYCWKIPRIWNDKHGTKVNVGAINTCDNEGKGKAGDLNYILE